MENGCATFGHRRTSHLIENFLQNIPYLLDLLGYDAVEYINVLITCNSVSFSRSAL